MTFIVLAPEHELINEVTTEEYKEKVKNYIKNSAKSSEIERTSTEREKTGQFTGGYAINPMNNKKIPIFIGDYVLGTYGTGAVMGVPAHDQRDYEFAKKYELTVDVVISKDGKITNDLKKANESYGILINSQNFDGLDRKKAKKFITDFME